MAPSGLHLSRVCDCQARADFSYNVWPPRLPLKTPGRIVLAIANAAALVAASSTIGGGAWFYFQGSATVHRNGQPEHYRRPR